MPPIAFRSLLRIASWIVPRPARAAWHDKWASSVRDWWTLVQRGELIRGADAQMAYTMRVAFTDAFWRRFNKAYLGYALRGPAFLLGCVAGILAAMAALTHAFIVTRTLAAMAAGRPARPLLAHEGPTGTLIAYLLPISLALVASAVLAATHRLRVYRHGWRYGGFLALKTAAILSVLSLAWIEGGTALRAHLHNPALHILGGALGLALIFVFAFGCALLWSFDDQRRRCPACLRLLILPVSIGSWGSLFEPAITEFLCEDGHGALALSEDQSRQPDRWTVLDASWRDLFGQEKKLQNS